MGTADTADRFTMPPHHSAGADTPVGSVAPPEGKPKFPKDEGFHAELRRRVDAYFRESGLARRGNWQMYLKTVAVLVWLVGSYVALVFVVETWWQAVPVAVLFSLALAAVGFNIQHDGGHGAYSRHAWVNRLAAVSLDLIGVSSYLWKWKHGIFHHTYTNITSQDTDIDLEGTARLSPYQPRRRFHRWQHLYLWVLYGVMAARWHLYGDFRDAAKGRIGPHKIPRPKGWDLVVFLLGKATSIGLLLVLPMFWHPWWVVVLFYLLVTGVLGMVLSIVFQLAHCVEEAAFLVPEKGTLRMPFPWAVHQVRSTVDFSRDSRVLAWLLGGLNFQVEHHLFPGVCHVHYPAVSRIVEQTCREYGVRYSVHRTFRAGLASHYRWLRRMGRSEQPDPGGEIGRSDTGAGGTGGEGGGEVKPPHDCSPNPDTRQVERS